MNKIKIPLMFSLPLLLISCAQTPSNNTSIEPSINPSIEDSSSFIENPSPSISESEPINNDDEIFNEYKEELCVLLANYYTSAAINISEENIDFAEKQMFDKAANNIRQSNTFDAALNNYKLAIKEINDCYPYANGVIDFTNSEDKVNIYKAIEDYLIRNNLTRLNIAEKNGASISLNVNSTNKETWEHLFGENGKVLKTDKEDYWDVKPALSNHFFIKALDLAINKEEIAQKFDLLPDTSLFNNNFYVYQNVNYLEHTNQIKDYKFDINEARKYFKLAMYELENQGLYTPGTKDNPTVIELEVAYMYETHLERYKMIHTHLEEAFNHEDVSNGKYQLKITHYIPDEWSDIFYKKFYCGQFDLGFGSISSSSLLRNDYFLQYLSSDTSISDYFTVNWAVDTNDASTSCIIYQNQKYSFDALYSSLHEKVVVVDGNLKDPCVFSLIDYIANDDQSYTTKVKLEIVENFDIEIKDIVIFFYNYKSVEDYYEESILENANITYTTNDKTTTIEITISKDLYDKYKGEFAFDFYYTLMYQEEIYEQTYQSLYL